MKATQNGSDVRIESDSMGELHVPVSALYGAQTQRAINNFPISGRGMPREFIAALLRVKRAAALANAELACVENEMAQRIVAACDELLQSEELLLHFPVDVFQTGSGTSSNMNANEVIATLANRYSEGKRIGANDHVNFVRFFT